MRRREKQIATKRMSADGKAAKKRKAAKLSRLHKPEGMSLEDWQIELRRQFGREQDYRLKNVGDQPIFSEFEVVNPQSRNAYRVRIRGPHVGDNYCSCPDFATNTLGTCKHIEFTLAALERKRGGAAALRAGYQPPYSEVFLQYGARREVRFRPGDDCPPELARIAGRYFGRRRGAAARGVRVASRSSWPRPDGSSTTCAAATTCWRSWPRCATPSAGGSAWPRRSRAASAAPPSRTCCSVSLYDYQREGALFAARAGRCLIGDEMGLGKTIQAIAAAEIMARLFGVERVLIVCPTSLKHQWQREIERFSGRTVEVVGGLRPRREPLSSPPTPSSRSPITTPSTPTST